MIIPVLQMHDKSERIVISVRHLVSAKPESHFELETPVHEPWLVIKWYQKILWGTITHQFNILGWTL